MIEINNISKLYTTRSADKVIFQDFNLKIKKGDLVGILGKNGVGKSTLLNMLAGIDTYNQGRILINRKKIKDAKIGYLFQNYRQTLFPWKKNIDNIALPLEIRGIKKEYRHKIVQKFCKIHKFNINLNAYPYSLSGGQQQQVAIIRTLIDKPDLVVLDEPFSSLDYYSSLQFQKEILSLWLEIKPTLIFVSHRIDEVLFLANRIIVFGNNPTQLVADFQNPIAYPRIYNDLADHKTNQLRKQILSSLEKV